MVSMLRWAVALVLLLATLAVQAHDLGVARITLSSPAPSVYQLEAKLPAKLDPADPVAPIPCSVVGQGATPIDRLTVSRSWQIDCAALSSPPGHWIRLDWDREAALVVVRFDGARQHASFVDANDGSVLLELAALRPGVGGWMQTLRHYTGLGFEHILLGLDHLAFVLVLMLIARGLMLVKLVTAFTVGHSITLTLAVLGWVAVPVPPTEAVIALSIAFLAREAMRPEDQRRHPLLLVGSFGMLHGLGFASALAEVGVDSQYLFLSLFAFNLGVELGQLAFIAVVLTAALAWRRAIQLPVHRFATVAAFGLGSLAMFWTFERMTGFLPVS